MGVTTTKTNKPLNPRGNDQSPKGYNRASLFSGKALDFDGVNDYVDLGTEENTNLVSYSFYLNLDSYSGSGIIGRNAGNADNYVQIWVSGNAIKFFVGSGSGNESIQTTTPKVGEWIHCVYVVDGTNKTQKVYFNGVLDLENTFALTLDTVNRALQIGALVQTAYPLNGQIASFKIFNTALTAAQVADLYNNPEKVVPTGVDNTALKLWLPMMEGAGTTAYDGSGNGNHGTISGATYVNGVGAPVSQSAVMDWNKGTNILEYSIWNNSYWTASGGVVTDGIEAPDGTNTAFKFERDGAFLGAIYKVAPTGLSSTNYRYVYAKLPSGTGSAQLLSHSTNTNNTFTIADQWQRFELNSAPNTAPGNFYIVDFRNDVGVDEIHLWAPQAAAGTDESVFVPTIGTAQSSDVLLPQGLTSGRDITGVNLFENVRKQGALNLDGNSWAEVHDNASLDITTAITLEVWIKYDGIGDRGVLGKWYGNNKESYLLYTATNHRAVLYIFATATSSVASSTIMTTGDWYHIVGTYDGSNMKVYVNGTSEGTVAKTGNIRTTDKEVEIGRYYDSNTYAYQDSIAQPRIYNRALTAEEVQRNYNAGKNTYTN